MSSVASANLMGIGALVMWCTIIGMVRSVTEAFGVTAGTALIYSVGALVTFMKSGAPKFRQIPKRYLFVAGSLFIAYELVFSQAVGMSENPRQTLEVGMFNYLWPCLTIVFSICILKIKLHWWVWPGTALAVAGLCWCVAANGNLDFYGFVRNLRATPLPYALGAMAGITWALYSNLSVRYSKGFNAIPLFFTVIAVILWTNFLLRGGELRFPGYSPVLQLLFIGAVMGFSYSMWENGIHHGNFILLAVCSYFAPAASMLFAALWLSAMPPSGYWLGVSLVIGGSLLCWLASIKKPVAQRVNV